MKNCIKCGVILVVGENWYESWVKKRQKQCKNCHTVYLRNYHDKLKNSGMCRNHPNIPIAGRVKCSVCLNKLAKETAQRRGMHFHPDIPDYLLREFQNNKCWLCGIKSNSIALHRDHNHQTGWIRGILCSPCNTKLVSAGVDESVEAAENYFRDHDLNPDLLEKIIDYLDNPPYFQLLDALFIPRPTGTYDEYMATWDEDGGTL